MGGNTKLLFSLAVLLVTVYACTSSQSVRDEARAVPGSTDGGGTFKVGKPYQVAGVWYHPAADPSYDETGIASWYGADFHGKRTANGAIYDMHQLTAAHRTLPMPSRVRVTNLENGRTVDLTINDRGPFAKGRIIDVSRRGAEVLGFRKKGTARVRVQLVNGIQQPEIVSISAQPAPVQPVATQPVAREPLGIETQEVGSANRIFVQAGAFSNIYNAQAISNQLASIGVTSVTAVSAGEKSLYRVRLGPIVSLEEAGRLLGRVMAAGYPDARVVVE